MVFYRKYRPQTIDDLDNATIRETLFAILKKETSHAFLFTGPKGLGKTSTARIIAKVVNCEKRTSGSLEPCNTCDQCISITSGTNLDVLEIDAASNRGIDEIRDLKEKIRLSPVAASKKVYIIDEVHMLTTEAFNALLKTLEEPPAHALFILCTTEPHKVPATIISRCFHLLFQPATREELVRSFKRIVAGENIAISDEALQTIAGLSERGFRDGAKMLEEIVALADGAKITQQFVDEKYHVSSMQSFITTLLTAFAKKDMQSALRVVSSVSDQGIESKYFLQEVMNTLHQQLLDRVSGSEEGQMEVEEITTLFYLLSQAYMETKTAVLPQLPLELAIIAYCEAKNVIARSEMTKQFQDDGRDPSTSLRMTQRDDGVTVSSLRHQVGEMKKQQALYGETKKVEEPKDVIKTTTVELEHAAPNGEITKEWLNHFWQQLIGEIKQHNHTVAGLLRGCAIGSFDRKTLVIATQYKFHKERLDELKIRDALINAAKLLTGKEVAIVVELKK